MHNTFFLAFTEHYISSLYSTQWSFYTVDIRITSTAEPWLITVIDLYQTECYE